MRKNQIKVLGIGLGVSGVLLAGCDFGPGGMILDPPDSGEPTEVDTGTFPDLEVPDPGDPVELPDLLDPTDPVDEGTDPSNDVTDPSDDVTDDTTDDIADPTDGFTEPVTEPVGDDVTDPTDGFTEPTGSTSPVNGIDGLDIPSDPADVETAIGEFFDSVGGFDPGAVALPGLTTPELPVPDAPTDGPVLVDDGTDAPAPDTSAVDAFDAASEANDGGAAADIGLAGIPSIPTGASFGL